MYNFVVQQIAHHVERQDTSVQVHHSDVSGQSGSIARTARSTPSLGGRNQTNQHEIRGLLDCEVGGEASETGGQRRTGSVIPSSTRTGIANQIYVEQPLVTPVRHEIASDDTETPWWTSRVPALNQAGMTHRGVSSASMVTATPRQVTSFRRQSKQQKHVSTDISTKSQVVNIPTHSQRVPND